MPRPRFRRLDLITGTQLWTPKQIAPAAWYDAADSGTITKVSGAVSQWNDKSGNGYHLTQGTAGKRPAIGSRLLNGLAVVDFDGGDILLNTFLVASSLNISYAQVFQSDTTGGGIGAFIGFGRTTSTEGYIRQAAGSPTLRGYGSRYPTQGEVYFDQDTAPHIVVYVKNGASSQEAWQDGTKGTERTTTVTTFTSQRLALGGAQDDSSYCDGFIAETILFGSSLSSDHRLKIEGYLAWKWGFVSTLPADHPYKRDPPKI